MLAFDVALDTSGVEGGSVRPGLRGDSGGGACLGGMSFLGLRSARALEPRTRPELHAEVCGRARGRTAVRASFIDLA